eukprot:3519362-Rhodomonas_salina.2
MTTIETLLQSSPLTFEKILRNVSRVLDAHPKIPKPNVRMMDRQNSAGHKPAHVNHGKRHCVLCYATAYAISKDWAKANKQLLLVPTSCAGPCKAHLHDDCYEIWHSNPLPASVLLINFLLQNNSALFQMGTQEDIRKLRDSAQQLQEKARQYFVDLNLASPRDSSHPPVAIGVDATQQSLQAPTANNMNEVVADAAHIVDPNAPVSVHPDIRLSKIDSGMKNTSAFLETQQFPTDRLADTEPLKHVAVPYTTEVDMLAWGRPLQQSKNTKECYLCKVTMNNFKGLPMRENIKPATYKCETCNIDLHKGCFRYWHSEKNPYSRFVLGELSLADPVMDDPTMLVHVKAFASFNKKELAVDKRIIKGGHGDPEVDQVNRKGKCALCLLGNNALSKTTATDCNTVCKTCNRFLHRDCYLHWHKELVPFSRRVFTA